MIIYRYRFQTDVKVQLILPQTRKIRDIEGNYN
jgi:hypothetical protein